MKANKPLRPKYSGRNSIEFWKQVNAIKDKNKHSEAYTLGVVLQNVEADILRLINLKK